MLLKNFELKYKETRKTLLVRSSNMKTIKLNVAHSHYRQMKHFLRCEVDVYMILHPSGKVQFTKIGLGHTIVNPCPICGKNHGRQKVKKSLFGKKYKNYVKCTATGKKISVNNVDSKEYIDVKNCAACSQDHKSLKIKRKWLFVQYVVCPMKGKHLKITKKNEKKRNG